ncbi:MAG: hypothetical protein U9P70_01315 [Patescibacteria group bacterium]|nr:hypothetical protein [Patescibacteria group bacterium]
MNYSIIPKIAPYATLKAKTDATYENLIYKLCAIVLRAILFLSARGG